MRLELLTIKIKRMNQKQKATQLVKISFNKIADASSYKGIKNGDDKQFKIIEDLSKKIAKDFINEIVNELKSVGQKDKYIQNRLDFWESVNLEIDEL